MPGPVCSSLPSIRPGQRAVNAVQLIDPKPERYPKYRPYLPEVIQVSKSPNNETIPTGCPESSRARTYD